MENDIRREQHYAVSKSGVLLHINQAHYSNEDCYCIHCGCHLLQKCGNVRRWHFAHDWRVTEEQKECSYESYLHSYAKLRLKQWFEESESIVINYQKAIYCKSFKGCVWRDPLNDNCKIVENQSCNIKSFLDSCEVEKDIEVNGDTFRPDLLWYNKQRPNNRIYIEIKVTHECSDKKKKSKERIIEFDVHCEEDVDNIIKNEIVESESVRFYGFKNTELDESGIIKPLYNLKKFILYRGGKLYANNICTCQDYRIRRPSSCFEMTVENQNIEIDLFYLYGLVEARNNGYKVPNCYLCKHHKYDSENKCLHCLVKSGAVAKGCEAVSCCDYEFDESHSANIKKDLLFFRQNRKVDYWSNERK